MDEHDAVAAGEGRAVAAAGIPAATGNLCAIRIATGSNVSMHVCGAPANMLTATRLPIGTTRIPKKETAD